MIIKAKSYFATAFFMDVREIVGSSPTMTVFYLLFPNFLFPLSSLDIFFLPPFPDFSPSVIPVLPASCHSRALFFSLSFPGLTGESMDVRVKPEHDRKKNKPEHDTKKNNPIMTERNNPEHDGEAGEHDGGMKRQSMTKKER